MNNKMKKIQNSDIVIKAESIYFKYDFADKPTLEDVSFSIFDKEFVSIIGPNGGGKSTLIKLLIGLLKQDSGKIEVFGKNPENVRNKIGYVPQYFSFDSLYPITAIDVVMMGRLNSNFFSKFTKKDYEMAKNTLDFVGMGGYEKKLLSKLSGGQRQRVLIARALAVDCKILILDEPTAYLDKEAQSFLYKLLQKINKEKTIVLVSHDVGFVPSISTKVICLNRTAFEYSKLDEEKNNEGKNEEINFYNCKVDKIT